MQRVQRRLSFRFMAALTATQVLVLSLAQVGLVWQQYRQMQSDLHHQARVLAQQLVATRAFIAQNQDRINQSSSDGHYEFKGLNPAAVGRGISEIFSGYAGYQMKQTRLHVRNPRNAPDAFEREALQAFLENRDRAEYWRRVDTDGHAYFRYAIPLTIEQECLQCHGGPPGVLDVAGYPKEGYELGDLGGAISITIPMDSALAALGTSMRNHLAVSLLLVILSLAMSYWLVRRLVAGPLEQLAVVAGGIGDGHFQVQEADVAGLRQYREIAVLTDALLQMSRRLEELYTGLEEKVAERTAQLQAANAQLEVNSAQLARANRLQSEFLTMISHEFRTPLTSILAFTELLQKGAAGQLTADQQDYLADVSESAQRLLRMVNDLLDLSRLEAGRIKLFTEALDLNEVLEHAARTIRPLAAEKEIDLQVAPAADLPLVLADPLRVEQILFNLLGNAVKFTPRGGRVSLGAEVALESGWARVWVEDTGPEVAPEEREQIFEAFRQGEGRGRQPGTGLGLALARSLVELHGGQIGVEDGSGGGSRFWFTLPLLPDEDGSARKAL